MARWAPSTMAAESTWRSLRRRENSRKPSAKMASMPVRGRLLSSTVSYRRLRSTPDQNCFSNLRDPDSARLIICRLLKMTTHEASDASTSCTSRLAPIISSQTCSSPFINNTSSAYRLLFLLVNDQLLFQRRWYARRNKAVGRNANSLNARRGQQPFIGPPVHVLAENQGGSAQVFDGDCHGKFIFKPRRRNKMHVGAPHHKHPVFALAHHRLRKTVRQQPVGSGALEKSQVAGMIDNAAGVGVFPVHAIDKRAAHESGGLLNRSAAASSGRSGGCRPKCRQVAAVAMRPRAVRIKKPS